MRPSLRFEPFGPGPACWKLLIVNWELGIVNIAKKYKAAEYNTICHFDKKFLTLVRASLLLLFF